MPITFTGNRIQDTYGRVMQISASTVYNGLGEVITFLPTMTCSYAMTASTARTADVAISASWAPDVTVTVDSASWASSSLSSSWSQRSTFSDVATYATSSTVAVSSSHAVNADMAISASQASSSLSSSYSLTTDGIIVRTAIRNADSVTITNTYTADPIQSAVTVGESNPHVSGRNCKSGSALFGGGWSSVIYRINNPDVNLNDITSASCMLAPRNISAGVYSATTNAVYYIVGGAYNYLPSTASIIKVDALTLSQSLFYDGIDNGSSGFGLPPIVADDNYLYVPTAADTSCQILKIDIISGSLVDSKTWNGAGGSHAAQMSDDKTFFIATTGGGSICRVNTADFSVISSSLSLGSITDDIAILNGYVYPVREAGFMTQFYKVDVNTLSSSIISATEHSYGSFTDGVNLYFGNFDANQMWVYPNGDLDAGPYVFNVVGQPNEMWFTDNGNIVLTSWQTSNIYLYSFPYKFVGIDKIPDAGTVLDVSGQVKCSTLSSSAVFSTGNIAAAAGDLTINDVTFSGLLRSTGSSFSVTQNGIMRVARITGSNPLGESGLRMSYITCSFLTASAGMRGTASWAEQAISASWAPTGVADTASFALFADSASWAPTGIAATASYVESASWAERAGVSNTTLHLPTALPVYPAIEMNFVTHISGDDTIYEALGPTVYNSTIRSASLDGTASYANFAKSASWAPSVAGTPTVSASWASSSLSASWAERSFTASYALNGGTAVTPDSTSWASASLSSSFIHPGSYQITSAYSAYAVGSTIAQSASWASSSYTASALHFSGGSSYQISNLQSGYVVMTSGQTLSNSSIRDNGVGLTAVGGAVDGVNALKVYGNVEATVVTASLLGTSSFADNAKSSSWGERSLTASYAHSAQVTSASWADRSGTSSYAHSTLTASYSLANPSSTFPASVTQSSWDLSMREMSAPSSGAWQGGIATAPLIGDHLGSIQPDLPLPLHNLTYWYLRFVDYSGAAGATTASFGMYQNRVPQSYVGGLTHSFQFYPVGIAANPPTNANVFWEIDLFALTSSLNPAANLYSAAVLVETKRITSSLNGFVHDSGSVITTSSYFNDPSNYLKGGSIMFFSIKRITPWNAGAGVYDSGSNHYTGSVDMITSRFSWNAA